MEQLVSVFLILFILLSIEFENLPPRLPI